jgi:SAM-dependent methyltransferase|tara:strand:+ start:176 stop:958 length:783 start_codon:yes stop_codon:yes gene_type:complete
MQGFAMSLERIWPVRDNLQDYLQDFPEHLQRYDLIADYIEGLDCADISCGVGYGAYLMGKLAKSVKGFDIAEEALVHAGKNFTSNNVSFHHLNELEDQKFQFISSIETLEHMSEVEGDKFLQKIHHALLPNGTLLISTPLNETQYKEHTTEFHIREYSFQEFKNKLETNGFSIENIYGISNTVSIRLASTKLGFSLMGILNTGLHRIIPTSIRKTIAKILLKKDSEGVADSCTLTQDSLHGAFCQIAICSIKHTTLSDQA